jgi:hypothetical protein
VLFFIGKSPYWILLCLIALLPLPTPSSAARSPNTRSDSVFENPAKTAKLTI